VFSPEEFASIENRRNDQQPIEAVVGGARRGK
jgi:hypothetical protein